MNIEVTDACNLNCSSCHTPHGSAFMTPNDFERIIQKLRPGQVRLHWRGEPCLHPHLPELAELAKKNGVRKLWLSTNTAVPNLSDEEYVKGLLENLDMLECSVDGYDQRSLERYRIGASWKRLTENLETIGRSKSGCLREMRVLMFRYNEGREDFYRKLAGEHGFHQISFAQPIINYGMTLRDGEAAEWLARDPRYQRYEKKGILWHLKRGPCSPHLCVSVHGSAHPCGHDWKLQHSLGNVLTESRADIMGRFSQLKPMMLTKSLPMCGKWCCLPRERVDYREKL